MIDKALFSKSPEYSGPMIEAFGLESFRDTNVHSKVTLIGAADKRIAIRSSMNLNKNLKTEQFDISVCDETYAFFLGWANELWDAAANNAKAEAAFENVFNRYTMTRGESVNSFFSGELKNFKEDDLLKATQQYYDKRVNNVGELHKIR